MFMDWILIIKNIIVALKQDQAWRERKHQIKIFYKILQNKWEIINIKGFKLCGN
jgi:hypothetical protein